MTGFLQPRRVQPRQILLTGGLLLVLAGWTVWRKAHETRTPAAHTLRFTGVTMGTTYSIRIVSTNAFAPGKKAEIENALKDEMARINRLMSAYDPQSEISAFNRAPAETPVPMSAEFESVTALALRLAKASGGVYDPTLPPLLRLWGFGPGAHAPTREPTEDEIRDASTRSGFDKVRIADHHAIKSVNGVELDLNSIAKGYGVDAVARTLVRLGYDRYMVEIGGEVDVAGQNATGEKWRIGVDRPDPDSAPGASVVRILHVTRMAIATSGDYRNFHDEPGGPVVSHIFDPRQGRPIRRQCSSVTVLAPDCTLADGLATTLFVMGADEGLPWLAREFPGIEALFSELQPDGTMTEQASPGFDALTAGPESRP